MKRLISLLMVLILLMGVTACGSVEKENQIKEQEEEKIQIGMSFDSFVIERWQRDRDIFVSVAKEDRKSVV